MCHWIRTAKPSSLYPFVPINKITASCPGLACSDPHGCPVPGVAFGSCSLSEFVYLAIGRKQLGHSQGRKEKRGKKGFSNTGIKCVSAPGFRWGSSAFLLAASQSPSMGLGVGFWSPGNPTGHSGVLDQDVLFGMLKHGQARGGGVSQERGVKVRKYLWAQIKDFKSLLSSKETLFLLPLLFPLYEGTSPK